MIQPERIVEAEQWATAFASSDRSRAYNWRPLMEAVTDPDSPRHIADDLQAVYFDYINRLLCDKNACGENPIAGPLYVFQSIIEAIRAMDDTTDYKTRLIVTIDGYDVASFSARL